jgi:hypothetical protein
MPYTTTTLTPRLLAPVAVILTVDGSLVCEGWTAGTRAETLQDALHHARKQLDPS